MKYYYQVRKLSDENKLELQNGLKAQKVFVAIHL